MLHHLKRIWKGEEKLWKVFWLWGVGGNILMIFLPHIISFFILINTEWYWLLAFIEMIVFFPLTLFLIFWNSNNTKYRMAAIISKYLSILLFVLIILFFFKTRVFNYLF